MHFFSLDFRETPTMSPHVAVTSFVFAFLVACTVSPTHATAADELIWRGDQATGRAIMDDLAKDYAKEKKGKITLQPFSTISGLDAVAQGSADIGGSARGKYARRYAQGTNVVLLDPDVAQLFPDSRAVNEALRTLTRLGRVASRPKGRHKRTA